jgi:hypothetical protein
MVEQNVSCSGCYNYRSHGVGLNAGTCMLVQVRRAADDGASCPSWASVASKRLEGRPRRRGVRRVLPLFEVRACGLMLTAKKESRWIMRRRS